MADAFLESIGTAEYLTIRYQEGYNAGYSAGRNSMSGEYQRGYKAGLADGRAEASAEYDRGYKDGQDSMSGEYTRGYNAGYTAGRNSMSGEYQRGYDAGYAAGQASAKIYTTSYSGSSSSKPVILTCKFASSAKTAHVYVTGVYYYGRQSMNVQAWNSYRTLNNGATWTIFDSGYNILTATNSNGTVTLKVEDNGTLTFAATNYYAILSCY